MVSIILFIDAVNQGMDYLVSGLCILLSIYVLVRYTLTQFNKYMQAAEKGEEDHPLAKTLFLGALALVELVVLFLLIGLLPLSLSLASGVPASTFRWIALYLVIPPLILLMTYKYSGIRGFVSTVILLTVGLVGWQFDQWLGVIFISLPAYAVLAYLTFHLAQVVLPVSNEETRAERWQKFKAFLWKLLGTQYPSWVAGSPVSRVFEKRIGGDFFNGFFEPGTVWSYSHQAVGISAGIEFDNAEGPGLLFTKTYNRPVAIVDLRTQIRTAEVDATTRDGVSIKTIVFTSFKVDADDWPKKGWQKEDRDRLLMDSKTNLFLQDGMKLDRTSGTYPYSTSRVKSVLSTSGKNTTPTTGEDWITFYWDEWVLMQVQNAARQVVSQRNLDQLWKPIKNALGESALNEMAAEIRAMAEPGIRKFGIQLFAARIVNFSIDKQSPIRQRQIESWKSVWTQKITAAQAEAEAAEKEEIEKAHAYAKSLFLGVIADGIRKANEGGNKQLSGKVIALYYIHAIEEYIKKAPEATNPEDKARVQTLKDYLFYRS